MIIYNVTINIDADIHQEFIAWMRATHIPEVMETGYFTDHKVCKIIGDESTGINYAIQYTAKNMDDYEAYKQLFAPILQKKVVDRYGSKMIAFRTLLEVI